MGIDQSQDLELESQTTLSLPPGKTDERRTNRSTLDWTVRLVCNRRVPRANRLLHLTMVRKSTDQTNRSTQAREALLFFFDALKTRPSGACPKSVRYQMYQFHDQTGAWHFSNSWVFVGRCGHAPVGWLQRCPAPGIRKTKELTRTGFGRRFWHGRGNLVRPLEAGFGAVLHLPKILSDSWRHDY
jgi:hypothetical protein